MLVALAVLSTLLACVGLYGVTSAATAARTRELAIRAALGARPAALLRLVLLQGLATAFLGVGIGAVASIVAAQGLGSLGNLLYGITPTDPATLAATGGLLTAISTLAAWLPARRALRLRPSEILRAE
jgi:ABC-type antimicrobial peptide transport system permease subunit